MEWIVIGITFGLSLVGLMAGSFSLIKIIAFEKSTHRIEYIPVDNNPQDFAKKLNEQITDEQKDLEL